VKQGAVMLAAIETVAKADPVWAANRRKSDVAAQAPAGESVHGSRLLKKSGDGTNEQCCLAR
jgi:hypothetical protein